LQTDHKRNPKFKGRNSKKTRIRNSNRLELRISNFEFSLRLAFGFAKAGDSVAFLPLTAFFEKFQALEALKNIPFSAQSGGCAQAAML
jgi:hypothetical protein